MHGLGRDALDAREGLGHHLLHSQRHGLTSIGEATPILRAIPGVRASAMRKTLALITLTAAALTAAPRAPCTKATTGRSAAKRHRTSASSCGRPPTPRSGSASAGAGPASRAGPSSGSRDCGTCPLTRTAGSSSSASASRCAARSASTRWATRSPPPRSRREQRGEGARACPPEFQRKGHLQIRARNLGSPPLARAVSARGSTSASGGPSSGRSAPSGGGSASAGASCPSVPARSGR